MRITAETQAATRRRILEEAGRLLSETGWEATTTRRIAAAAGIATGTLFNYFPSKEAIAEALISEAMVRSEKAFSRQQRGDESLEEDLFAYIWTGLKGLRRLRGFLAPAAETMFSPLRRYAPDAPGDEIRVRHLETAEQIIVNHGVPAPLPVLALELYWTLYLGVFAHWTADTSPNQEDTMALLDHSLRLFIASLPERRDEL